MLQGQGGVTPPAIVAWKPNFFLIRNTTVSLMGKKPLFHYMSQVFHNQMQVEFFSNRQLGKSDSNDLQCLFPVIQGQRVFLRGWSNSQDRSFDIQFDLTSLTLVLGTTLQLIWATFVWSLPWSSSMTLTLETWVRFLNVTLPSFS